jgi:hypothetical protein
MGSADGEQRKEGVSKGQTAHFMTLNDFRKECGKQLGKLHMLQKAQVLSWEEEIMPEIGGELPSRAPQRKLKNPYGKASQLVFL